jgi:Fe-S-cluster-containing dehydrogenase component
MAQYAMVIDVGRCTGCYNCFVACRDEHAGNDYPPIAAAQPDAGQRWIDLRVEERGSFPKVKVWHIPVPCLHCADAPCMRAATGGAVYRRDDGVILIDPEKAHGQRTLVASCPYGAIFWNEGLNLPQKCTFCAHLLDQGWKEPRCVESCPTQAIVFGDLDDRRSDVAALQGSTAVERLDPQSGGDALVAYFGLPRLFLTGEVVLADDADAPARGVAIVLRRNGEALTTATDNYGDFEFDGLASGDYTLVVEHPGYAPREIPVRTGGQPNLGTIVLEPRDS